MGGRIEFREKLSGILKMAEENGCQITIDEVECYFEEEHLSKEQIELVFDYLLAQKIVVKGYEKTGGSVTSSEENKTVFTEEEQRYLKEYMKDIGGIREAAEEEREALFEKVLEGDALAKSRLVEIYLHRILPCLNTIGIHSADADRSGTLLVDQGHQILIRFSSQHHLYNIHCFLICIA